MKSPTEVISRDGENLTDPTKNKAIIDTNQSGLHDTTRWLAVAANMRKLALARRGMASR